MPVPMSLLEPSPSAPIDAATMRWQAPLLALLSARRVGSLPQHCLWAVPASVLPSVAFLGLAHAIAWALGMDVSSMNPPDRPPSLESLFSGVVFAPVVETLLLAGLLGLLSRLSRRPLFVAAASGVLWGGVHGAYGAMWFFGTFWSFYVLGCSYLAWRPLAWWKAFVVAAVPHAIINLMVWLLLFLAR